MEQDANVEPAPKRIGPYKVLRLIGEGGMGAVYEAEQSEPVRRRVALKLIKLGMDTKQVVSRFDAERQALAVMDHPNIARMLDAGATVDGRPYFVMELVAGEPITDYCDRHRLTTRERLRLFTQACGAVQHAHQKGIIHRDLKPTNILVEVAGGSPLVKVIDFGIAKAVSIQLTEATLLTQAGQIVGSPSYMSPEQAESSGLDVDTRTDVYSLGVVLYELLVGALPFDRSFFSKPDLVLQYLLRDTDAPRPSVRLGSLANTQETVAKHRGTEPRLLRRELRGDLDWIVMRAMEKDRTRRYETPLALAQDVQRHIAAEPVEARPPTTAYRTSRFVRRHRVVVGATATVVTVLVAASVTLAIQAVRLAEERDSAQQMATFLEELFSSTDPFERTVSWDTITVPTFVQLGAERVLGELDGQPGVQARMQVVLGRVLRNLGRFAEARRLAESAVARYDDLEGSASREAIGSRQLLGWVLLDLGEIEAATETFTAARDARIAAGMAGDLEFGNALSGLGNANMTAGRFEEAEAIYRSALDVYEDGADAGVPRLAQARSNIAASLVRQAKYAEAESLLREALAMGSEELPPEHPNMLSFANNLAFLLQEVEREEEAEALYRSTLELTRVRFDPPHPQIARSLNNLGSILVELNRPEEARPLLREAVQMRRELYGDEHASVASSIHNLGSASLGVGDAREARNSFEEALRIYESTLGPDHPRIATVLGSLGRNAHEAGDHAEAAEHYSRADGIRAASLGDDHPLTASLRLDYGREMTELGSFASAEEILLRAYAALDGRPEENGEDWRLAHERLIELYESMDNADEAGRYRRLLAEVVR